MLSKEWFFIRNFLHSFWNQIYCFHSRIDSTEELSSKRINDFSFQIAIYDVQILNQRSHIDLMQQNTFLKQYQKNWLSERNKTVWTIIIKIVSSQRWMKMILHKFHCSWSKYHIRIFISFLRWEMSLKRWYLAFLNDFNKISKKQYQLCLN